MGLTLSKFGDWSKAGIVMKSIMLNLKPTYIAKLKECGELYLEEVLGHIDSQDLDWTPLTEHTVALKGGDDTIYVETGFLKSHLKVRKVRSVSNGVTFFIGADPWTTTPSGEKFSDVMIWLEYGTDKMVARPLLRPSWEEVEPIIQSHLRELTQDFVTGGAM